MINLEDLTVKNVILSKIKFLNHRNLELPSPEKPLFVIFTWMPISLKVKVP